MTTPTINLAALAKRIAGDWQPMETAPLHERILMRMKHGIIEGSYDGDVGFGYYWRDMEWYPTAWMPLPDAAHQQAEIARLFGPVVEALEKSNAALQKHHDWQCAFDVDDPEHGLNYAEAYVDSGMCEQTTDALHAAAQALAALAAEGGA